MENDGNEFTKQFIGSASANVVFMVGILIYKFIEVDANIPGAAPIRDV